MTAALQRLRYWFGELKAMAGANRRIRALEQQRQQQQLRLDWLEAGVIQHNQRLDQAEAARDKLLHGLDQVGRLLPPVDLPFAWQTRAPSWLTCAEARIGRPAASLDPVGREQAFYSYYSEMGGDHGHILQRQYDAYWPLLQQAWSDACAAVGVDQRPPRVLDIGCGAGEFLQFLKGRGLPVLGLDLSATEVERARADGLDAQQGEAVDYLGRTGERFAAITLFQVIEHLPPGEVLPLLQACSRHLAPGGVLLVETVNLRHPLALNGFFTDPTHRTPLSDNYLSFLFQWVGLQEVGYVYTLPDPVAGLHPDWSVHYANYAVCGRCPVEPAPV